MTEKYFKIIIILLSGILIISTFLKDQLGFFIHPRYFSFTTVAAIVISVIAIIDIAHKTKKDKFEAALKQTLESKYVVAILVSLVLSLILPAVLIIVAILFIVAVTKEIQFRKFILKNFNYLIITLLLIFAIMRAPTPLSSSFLQVRADDINAIKLTSDKRDISVDTKSFSVKDWVASFSFNNKFENYVGKEVEVSGFIFDSPELEEGYFMLSRFVLTCCAPDARPIGLKVKYDWEQSLEIDDWVMVNGKFETVDSELVIIPDKFEQIDIPNNPYEY